MGNLKYKLRMFMTGRYGNDELNRCILILTLILLVVSMFAPTRIFYYLTLAGLIITYYRMLSRNIYKRQSENAKYLRMTAGLRGGFAKRKSRSLDKEHRYFDCPTCRQTVRVPRGRGKIEITCPKCASKFVRKS